MGIESYLRQTQPKVSDFQSVGAVSFRWQDLAQTFLYGHSQLRIKLMQIFNREKLFNRHFIAVEVACSIYSPLDSIVKKYGKNWLIDTNCDRDNKFSLGINDYSPAIVLKLNTA